jgi:hypothetical protein
MRCTSAGWTNLETTGERSAAGERVEVLRGEPGLNRAGLRQAVAVLSSVQIVSWGVLYYAFAALQSSITAETGWSGLAAFPAVLPT